MTPMTKLCETAECPNVPVVLHDGLWVCIDHFTPTTTEPAAPTAAELVDLAGFDDTVSIGLAALILDAIADACDAESDAVPFIFMGLSTETGMTLDTAAGILLAGTTLAKLGEWESDQLRESAQAYREYADNEGESK